MMDAADAFERDPDADVSESDMLQFHLEEYKSLRTEIGRWSAEVRFLERSGVIGPVLLYSWLFTRGDSGVASHAEVVLWVAPVVCAVFLWIRTVSVKRFEFVISDYIRSIETVYRRPSITGWEHFLADQRGKDKSAWHPLVGIEHGYWLLLVLIYAIVALWRLSSLAGLTTAGPAA